MEADLTKLCLAEGQNPLVKPSRQKLCPFPFRNPSTKQIDCLPLPAISGSPPYPAQRIFPFVVESLSFCDIN
jgi:hypothetical protein